MILTYEEIIQQIIHSYELWVKDAFNIMRARYYEEKKQRDKDSKEINNYYNDLKMEIEREILLPAIKNNDLSVRYLENKRVYNPSTKTGFDALYKFHSILFAQKLQKKDKIESLKDCYPYLYEEIDWGLNGNSFIEQVKIFGYVSSEYPDIKEQLIIDLYNNLAIKNVDNIDDDLKLIELYIDRLYNEDINQIKKIIENYEQTL